MQKILRLHVCQQIPMGGYGGAVRSKPFSIRFRQGIEAAPLPEGSTESPSGETARVINHLDGPAQPLAHSDQHLSSVCRDGRIVLG